MNSLALIKETQATRRRTAKVDPASGRTGASEPGKFAHLMRGAPVNDPPPRGPSVQLTAASAIKIRPVKWLWDGRLALGALALLGGREGTGKSSAIYALAADITRGRLDGVFKGIPRAVIIAATEDSREHTIVPRLMAAGADLDRVYFVDVATPEGTDTPLVLPRDLDELRARAEQVGAVLVILDPLLSRLDAALNTHKDAEVLLLDGWRPSGGIVVKEDNEAALSIMGLVPPTGPATAWES